MNCGTTFNYQPTIELLVQRCMDCGSFWAIEKLSHFPDHIHCPVCAGKKIDEANAATKATNRRIRALVGVISRIKNSMEKK